MKALFKAVLLDIEGTTTPIDFVTKTLFPYASRELHALLVTESRNSGLRSVGPLIAADYRHHVEVGLEPPNWADPHRLEGSEAYLRWLMERDMKATGLKALQGLIWESGYRSGELRGEVYPDVKPAFERWLRRGASIHIFSSGSVQAQRLLFGHSTDGDLMPMITSYFDTQTGQKREPSSYSAISSAIGVQPSEIHFFSDVLAEVDAARSAGMEASVVVREGSSTVAEDAVTTFDDVP